MYIYFPRAKVQKKGNFNFIENVQEKMTFLID